MGRTVIEKFEEHASEAGFAIILLTADDEGKDKDTTRPDLAHVRVIAGVAWF